jgi:uncharacterized membrane protein
LAPPTAVLINLLSLVLGLVIGKVFLFPLIAYLVLIILGSLLIGRGLSSRLLLPIVLITMHMVWGVGYLISPKNLVDSVDVNEPI